jgi:antitoxin PrlF
MITSRISRKAQTTLPRAVRTALGVSGGDELAYEIKGREVVITRAGQAPADDPFAVFDEWASDADAKAYAGL